MGMNVGSSSDDEEVMMDINTTPLIDVMLVLLIMFIITIPIQTHAVKMNMPVPSNAPPPTTPPEIVRIDVDFDGTVGWNGEIIGATGPRSSRVCWPWPRCPTRRRCI
jgi:biopolymer transport protein ExbD